jgi:AcrR family transcriptional regulator
LKTRDKILDTSLELFNEKGYGNVGNREIARYLNISPGNLSYHFSKKEDILIHLLNEFRDNNSNYYNVYHQGVPSLDAFLGLMKNIFHSQYKFRGVYIGNQFVQMDVASSGQFDYVQNASARLENFRQIFTDLVAHDYLKASESGIDFLVSFISLFGRFWIQEVFLLQTENDEEKIIRHYLKILKKQLSMFATKKGKKSIKKFSLKNFIA